MEVTDGGMNRQQFPFEGDVACLCRELPREEGEQSQGGAAEMLQDDADMGVGGVNHEADGKAG